jgi:hypothetical protein
VRCPTLIGRQEPAGLIAGAVRRLTATGRGGALVVTGEAGIGKSRLAEHMSALAARADVRVVTGRAMPAGIGGPLGPIAEVIQDISRGRPVPADQELAPYLAVLATLVPHWRPPGWSAPAEPVLVTAEAVLRVLHWATEGRGVVVIAEDLNWADDATLAVTRYLADHPDEVPVAAGRPGGGGGAGGRGAPAAGGGPAGHRRPGRDPAQVRGHGARPAGPPRHRPAPGPGRRGAAGPPVRLAAGSC